MRVAVVTESFLPSANGVVTSVVKVLDHLAAAGHEALVVCPGPAPARYAGFEVRETVSLTYRGFPVGLPTAHLQQVLHDFAPDVVHAASPFLLGAQAVAWARRRDVPSVAVFQTDVAGFARRHRLALTDGPAWRWLRAVHSAATTTLAPSTATLAELRRRGFPRTRLWPRGVDADGYHPRHRLSDEGARLRRRLLSAGPRQATPRLLVGYVGRLAPEKRTERLATLADLPGARLVVVGNGPSAPRLARALAGTDAALLGRLDGRALATAYACLDVFVHTGTDETFGQTLQEAMASGVPVVAPASGGPLDVVDHGTTGLLFAPHDDEAMRDAVAGLVDDDPARLRMGEAARRAVLPRTWSGRCAELVAVYREVVECPPAPVPPIPEPATPTRL